MDIKFVIFIVLSILLFFTIVNIMRIEYQNIIERKLSCFKNLEAQIEESDREIAEIRREVERFYKKTDERKYYSRQLLEKIDDLLKIN